MKWTYTERFCNVTGNAIHKHTVDLTNATDKELIELWVMLTEKLRIEV